jgi:hypothetical protein
MTVVPMKLWRLSPVSPDRPPLHPTAEHARAQLAHELAKPQYQAARPTWLDLLVAQLEKWVNSLFVHASGGLPTGSALITIVIVVVVAAAIVIGFLVFGLPRINRRSESSGALFGVEDDRDADSLRRAAEHAAAAGDFATAIEEGYRAIARGLAERVAVTTFPGTTAHTFASQATQVFPQFHADLSVAADTFDRVRYLGSAGTEQEWQVMRGLDANIRQAKPLLEPVSS